MFDASTASSATKERQIVEEASAVRNRIGGLTKVDQDGEDGEEDKEEEDNNHEEEEEEELDPRAKARLRWKVLCLVKTADVEADEAVRKEKIKERVDEWMSRFVSKLRISQEEAKERREGTSVGESNGAAADLDPPSLLPDKFLKRSRIRERKQHEIEQKKRIQRREEEEKERERQLMIRQGKRPLMFSSKKKPPTTNSTSSSKKVHHHHHFLEKSTKSLFPAQPGKALELPPISHNNGVSAPNVKCAKSKSPKPKRKRPKSRASNKSNSSSASSKLKLKWAKVENGRTSPGDVVDRDLHSRVEECTETVIANLVYDETTDELFNDDSLADPYERQSHQQKPPSPQLKEGAGFNPVFNAMEKAKGVDELFRIAEVWVNPELYDSYKMENSLSSVEGGPSS